MVRPTPPWFQWVGGWDLGQWSSQFETPKYIWNTQMPCHWLFCLRSSCLRSSFRCRGLCLRLCFCCGFFICILVVFPLAFACTAGFFSTASSSFSWGEGGSIHWMKACRQSKKYILTRLTLLIFFGPHPQIRCMMWWPEALTPCHAP